MDFEQVEDKIIKEIEGAMPYVPTVESYAGQLDQDIKQLTFRLPAIFVSYGGSVFQWVDGPNHNETSDFSVLVVAQNLRGEQSARKGLHGCYQMIKDVLVALTNNKFGLDIEKLVPLKTSLIYVSKTIVIYGIDFRTNFDTTFND